MQNENIIGTLRLVFEGNTCNLGRLAVAKSERRQGIATKLLQEATTCCLQQGITKIRLGSQIKAKGFYQNLGFLEEGDIFSDAGIPHIHMVKIIK